MKTFTVRDTNHAMHLVYSWLGQCGVYEPSRNGEVLRAPVPVAITYTHPLDRVNFCSLRDANPAFHLLESIWMLAGANQLMPLKMVVGQIAEYSDDGTTLNAAYGYRARAHFNKDQLIEAAHVLKEDPFSRQAVIQFWDPKDLGSTTKDKACNMALVFQRNPMDGRLDMTICNRSNDAIWGGVSGANVVHMPFFLELVAFLAGFTPGQLTVISTNLHVYLDNPKTRPLLKHYEYYQVNEPYDYGGVQSEPLLQHDESVEDLFVELNRLLVWFVGHVEAPTIKNRFLAYSVMPLLMSWKEYKKGNLEDANLNASVINASDWRTAMLSWIKRRN